MFYYKPTEYSPTASQRFANGSQLTNYTKRSLYMDPTKGASGDPNQKVQPNYLIKKNDTVHSESQRFLRNSMEVDDIEGTRSKRRMVARNVGVGLGLIGQSQIEKLHFSDTIMLNKDIYGTHPHKDMRVFKEYAYDTYRDVTHAKKNYQKAFDRQVPSHASNYHDYAKITSLNPHDLKKEFQDTQQLSGYYTSRVPVSLTTEDIDYSSPGTVGYGPFRRIPRREHRDPIYIDDIDGARSNNAYKSTLRQSKREGSYARNTDPLNPDYQYIGQGHMGSSLQKKQNLSFEEVKNGAGSINQRAEDKWEQESDINDRIREEEMAPQQYIPTNEYQMPQQSQQQQQPIKINRDELFGNNNARSLTDLQMYQPQQQMIVPQQQQQVLNSYQQFNQELKPHEMNPSNFFNPILQQKTDEVLQQQHLISRNKKFTGLDTMRPAGTSRQIGLPQEPPSQYFSKVCSLPVLSKSSISYGIYKQNN